MRRLTALLLIVVAGFFSLAYAQEEQSLNLTNEDLPDWTKQQSNDDELISLLKQRLLVAVSESRYLEARSRAGVPDIPELFVAANDKLLESGLALHHALKRPLTDKVAFLEMLLKRAKTLEQRLAPGGIDEAKHSFNASVSIYGRLSIEIELLKAKRELDNERDSPK